MHPQVVQDQKHFSASICNQGLQELNEFVRVERFINDHPARLTLVGHLGQRLGRNALLMHLLASKRIGVDHLIFNLKYGKRPAEEVLQELAEFVLPEFV